MTGLSGRARERRGFLSLDEFLRTSHLFQRIEKTSTVETGHCRRGKRLPRLVLSWHGRDSREALSPFELSRTLFLFAAWHPARMGASNFRERKFFPQPVSGYAVVFAWFMLCFLYRTSALNSTIPSHFAVFSIRPYQQRTEG